MNKRLYLQAKRNIWNEIEDEITERVRQDYKDLIYEAQLRKADKPTLKEIKSLYRQSKGLKRGGFGDFYTWHLQKTIKEFAKTGFYHQDEFKEIRKVTNSRIKPSP